MCKKLLLSLLATTFLVSLLGTLTGCNTVSGAGKDLERGGEKLQQEAEEHK